jgi:hypothetical protein
MEPMVIFSAGMAMYCGYIALVDAVRDRQSGKVKAERPDRETRRTRATRKRVISAAAGREGGGGGHWPRPLTGSA